MNHYINKNGDVLVSNDEDYGLIGEDFFEIPYFNYNSSLALIQQVGLFLYCKAYYLERFCKMGTLEEGIIAQLRKLGVENINYFTITPKEVIYKSFRHYSCFWLLKLYCNNINGFMICKPFILPKEYIEASLDFQASKANIKSFKEKLLAEGFVAYEKY